MAEPLSYKVKLDDEEWQKYLDIIKRNLNKATDMLLGIASNYVFKDIVEHFRDESSEDGKWPTRNAATDRAYDLANKRHAWFDSSNKLLHMTDRLRGSLLSPNSEGGIKKEGQGKISVFTTVPYAARHNYGYKNTPQREFMWLSNKAMDFIAKGMIDAIDREGLT